MVSKSWRFAIGSLSSPGALLLSPAPFLPGSTSPSTRPPLRSAPAPVLRTPQYRPPDVLCRCHRRRLQHLASRSPVSAARPRTGRRSSAPAGSDLCQTLGRGVCTPPPESDPEALGRRRAAVRGAWRRPQRCAPGSAAAAASELNFPKRVGTALLSWIQSGGPSVPLLRSRPPVSGSVDCPRAAAKLSAPVATPSVSGLRRDRSQPAAAHPMNLGFAFGCPTLIS